MAKKNSEIFPVNVGDRGRVHGAISITYNVPFPTQNGSFGSGKMQGVVMHTEVGFDPNVIREFNDQTAGASATFSITKDGHVHQYGPIGKGWYAWAQVAGNRSWYSIECEDEGHPTTPLTEAQVTAFAQLAECLSDYAGFPLQITNSVDGEGIGVHFMGGAAWGGHTCPDVPPKRVRSEQRDEILKVAKQLRAMRKA
jgi:hypothetical protein